nr:putative ribonuclease H-like domain-containing protein [Tanacetum cinerariifolium]
MGVVADSNILELTTVVSPIPTTRIHKDHHKEQIIGDPLSAPQTRRMTKTSQEYAMVSYIKRQRRTNHKDYQNCLFAYFLSQIEPKKVNQALIDPSWIEAMQDELLQFRLQKVWRLVDLPKGKHAIRTKWVYRNKKDERGIVVRNKARLVAQGYTQEEGIDYDEVFAPVARIEAIRLFLAYASFMRFIVYQMGVKSAFLYGIIEEEVYVCQPPGFENPHFPDKVEKALYGLHQAFKACQDKYVADILKKFDFSSVKTASTPIETNKAFLKDEEVEDVDVHLYRSMIGSLMYITASRPGIMFVVCAYARFQVTPKVSHLHAVKRIFRYLKGQPKLGLWYPRDSPFNLKAFSDSDYVRASLDRKSIIGEYVAANCCGQLWATANVKNVNVKAHIQALVDKKKVIIIEALIRRDLRFEDKGGIDCLSNEVIFEQLTRMSIMASAIICLATNKKFNFSKYIFDNMVKHLDGEVKFLMYPRSVQVFLDNQVEGMDTHNAIFVISFHTKKVFANMKREGKGFSGVVIPLFQTMMVQAPKEVGKGSEIPTNPHHTPTTQPSSSQPQRKQNTRRKQRNETKVPSPSSEIPNEKGVPTTLNDPLTSGEDRMQLNELMILCTNLQKQEDTSKQGRMIDNIDQVVEITLVDKTQGRMNKEDMFGVNDLDGDEVIVDATAGEKVEQSVKVVEKEVSTAEVTTAATTLQISKDELTLAQTLIEIKTAKPKVITTAVTTATVAGTRPKVKGIVMQELSETPLTKQINSSQQSSQAKDKNKGKMVKPERPLKRKDHNMIDAEVAKNLEARIQAKLEEEERLARLKAEETNISLIES